MKKEEAKTKAKALVVLGAFLLSIFSVVAVAGQAVPLPPPPVPIPGPVEPTMDGNYTQLQISPRYEWLQIEPGDEKEFTVNVKNKEEESVFTSPRIEIPPYGEYYFEEDWITVELRSAEIKAGEEQKFTVKVEIPVDAEIGHYSAQIVFTNDTIPTPAPFPVYVNAFEISMEVWTPPKILIQPQYIHDRVEAGQSYEYKILLENKCDKAIAINPEFGGESRYWGDPYGPNELPEDWLTIEAPTEVEANSKATVKVTVNVLADAKGMYEGSINLNIDDSSIREWDQMVRMHIEVWKQPTTPYREDFTVKPGEKFSVEITARQHAYDRYGGGAEEKEEPSFDVTLTTPEGGKRTPEPSKTVKKGEVSLGMDYLPPWESSSGGMYHVMRTEYSETYEITNATGGVWTLEILPRNAENFEYTIEIGG